MIIVASLSVLLMCTEAQAPEAYARQMVSAANIECYEPFNCYDTCANGTTLSPRHCEGNKCVDDENVNCDDMFPGPGDICAFFQGTYRCLPLP